MADPLMHLLDRSHWTNSNNLCISATDFLYNAISGVYVHGHSEVYVFEYEAFTESVDV